MLSLLLGAILLGAIHALIPNHWMPLVLLGKAERWRSGETYAITAIAGFAHTSSTILIGLLVGLAGVGLATQFELYSTLIAPCILIALGVFYVILDLRGKGGHTHSHTPVLKPPLADGPSKGGKALIVGSLVTAMFFSPCLEIEAYYLTAASFGWTGILSVSLIYLVLTVTCMLLFVYLGLNGLALVNGHFLEHHEKLVTGVALIVVGVAAFFIH